MTYCIYVDDRSNLHAVKRGFSWPAFFVPEIWLFLRGLRLDACVVIAFLLGAAAVTPLELRGLILLTLRVVTGSVTNGRIATMFRSKGWQRLDDVDARSMAAALEAATSAGRPSPHAAA